MGLLNKSLSEINYKNILIIYITYALIVLVLSSIYCNLTLIKFDLAESNYDIIFRKLQFDFGKLTHNLYYNDSFYQNRDGVIYHLFKSPLNALILVSIAKISKNIFFIFILKNLITFSIYFFSAYICLKSLNKKVLIFLLVLMILFINPYNIHVGLNIYFEDNLIALLLPSLFLIILSLNKKKYLLSAIIIFLLYLTKSSMFFLTIVAPFSILLVEKNNMKLKIIPLYGIILAIVLWGSFGYIKTERFPFASSLITSNSEALNHVVLNKKFIDYYPYKSVDLIPKQIEVPKNLKNEWEVYDFYNQKNKEYLKENFFDYLSSIPIKIKFIFFNVYKDSVFPDKDGKYTNKFMFSYLLNKIFFNLGIFVLLIFIIKNSKNNFSLNKLYNFRLEIYYLFFLVFSLFPHIVAWATAKHLVAIQQISLIYLVLKFSEKFNYR